MIPDLSPDAELLLQKLADKARRDKSIGPYRITEELLKELGFDSEKALAKAVNCLHAHAHDFKAQWGNGPIVRIEEESDELVPGPFMKDCWGYYRAERRYAAEIERERTQD